MESDDGRRRNDPDSKVLYGKEGSFAILEVIGKGAYGTVYKGLWREVGKYVAIKRVLSERLTDDETKSLQAEIYLFKNLKHAHIVNYIEAIENDSSNYFDIIMEYVEGGSLFKMVDLIRKSQTNTNELIFNETLIANFVHQILFGLQYLHGQGIIHRDIKGANLLITKDRHIKLTDFGVSSFTMNNNNQPSNNVLDVAGTPYWMAPEIIMLTGSSTASDIWSLGCTLIELLTGSPPYHQYEDITALFKIVSDDCPPLPPNISAECEDFLRKCFNKDVQARATADELLQHKWIIMNDDSDSGKNVTEQGSSFPNDNSDVQANTATNDNNGNGKQQLSEVPVTLDQYEEDDDDFDDIDFEVSQSDKSDGSSSFNNIDALDVHNNGFESHANTNGAIIDPFDNNEEEEEDSNDDATIGKSMKSLSLRDDPFQDLMDDPEVDRERERIRKEKEIWQIVKDQVSRLGKSESKHAEACDTLIDIFKTYPEQRYNLIYEPGLLPIIEILENNAQYNATTIESMLRVILSLVELDERHEGPPLTNAFSNSAGNFLNKSDVREDLCLAGILPVVMRFCHRKHSYKLRLLAGRFIKKMIESSDRILYMFVSCGGFAIFVDLLESDFLKYRELCNLSVFGIYKLFAMNNHKYKRDFCRKFVWNGLLDRIIINLSNSLHQVDAYLSECDPDTQVNSEELSILECNINELTDLLKVFAARSDSIVKSKMITANVLQVMNDILQNRHKRILKLSIQSILCGIRDLTRDPQTHESLEKGHIINTLVVEYLIDKRHNNTDIMHNVNVKHFIISSLHNLCIVSAPRQERIVQLGIARHLQKIILSKDINMKSLCIDLYSGLACSSHLTRIELSKENGIEFYIELMTILCERGTVRKWQVKVLQSIYEWLEDAKLQAYVESRLSLRDNKHKFCHAVMQTQLNEIEGILEPYLKIITVSNIVNQIFGSHHELVVVMIRWLERMYNNSKSSINSSSPRGRLLLLRTLLAHARQWKLSTLNMGIVSGLKVLLNDMILVLEDAITVREQATTLLTVLDTFKSCI